MGADSLVQPYSVSKPFAAVCALRLVQAGRLDLDARCSGTGFRAPATVRHVLPHQAGVVMLGVIYRNTLTWACSGCGQQVTERGPAGRPVHVEHGHVPDCARLARQTAGNPAEVIAGANGCTDLSLCPRPCRVPKWGMGS